MVDTSRVEGGSHDSNVASAIMATYEARLPEMSRSVQRHFAQRMYRITGDEKYLPANLAYAKSLARQLQRDFEGLSKPGYALERAEARLSKREAGAEGFDDAARREKYRARHQVLARWGEMPFAISLLSRLNQVNSFGLLETPPFAGSGEAVDYLKSIDFRSFLTDQEVVSVYAAQVANISQYLFDLGVSDLRQEASASFLEHYSKVPEAGLSLSEFRNMLYGLTHFVIASSGYYQRFLDRREVDWVLAWLERSVERIDIDATPDIQAEVGLCFSLCQEEQSPVLQRMKSSVVSAYDDSSRMIPSEAGGTDLEDGEHRNVLAIMLLRWPKALHPGPRLDPWPTTESNGRDRFWKRLKNKVRKSGNR